MAGDREPYDSFGNGSGMRVSPVAWANETLEEVEEYAKMSSNVTHSHPEGIKGAQVVAASVFLARRGKSKDLIWEYAANYGCDRDRKLIEFGPSYRFSSRTLTSVPEAIICFLESEDFESSIKNAIWLGSDSDTQAAITGSLA